MESLRSGCLRFMLWKRVALLALEAADGFMEFISGSCYGEIAMAFM